MNHRGTTTWVRRGLTGSGVAGGVAEGRYLERDGRLMLPHFISGVDDSGLVTVQQRGVMAGETRLEARELTVGPSTGVVTGAGIGGVAGDYGRPRSSSPKAFRR